MKDTLQLVLIIGIAIAAFAILGEFASHLLISGILIGVITVCGLAILWVKSPPVLKKWIAKGDLIVDATATVVVFYAFGFTLTGLVSAGVTCLFLSILLKINRICQGR